MTNQTNHFTDSIARVFDEYAQHQDSSRFVAETIAILRPQTVSTFEPVEESLRALCSVLNADAEKARLLREALLELLSTRHPVSLFLVSRHSVFSGFFAEMRRRIAHKILPDAINPDYLVDLFSIFFSKTTDEIWVNAVPDDVWISLIEALRFDLAEDAIKQACQGHLYTAAEVLSYRIAALGLEPELLKNAPELEQHDSPFVTQQAELAVVLSQRQAGEATVDVRHSLVMLDQCRAVITKIRRNSVQAGTSIQLTQLLQRMLQQVSRLEELLTILQHFQHRVSANQEIVTLFKALVYSECHKNDLDQHLRENMELMAVRVTENASRRGEHYITEDRRAYFALMRSAMGAGVIIAAMAMIKISLSNYHFAPLTEAILFSLNYGLGFILIHILHFTVATKQPAMTAAVIAATIDQTADHKHRDMSALIAMIANTARSQLVAIIGNVIIAIPTAVFLAWVYLNLTGRPFVDVDKASKLLADIDPLHSGAVLYAGIAGVCLFLSGLIAGYHDNLAIYNKIPQRLRAVGWLRRLLGEVRLARMSDYIENNLGALAGNFYFGCLLGGISGLGILLGLPIDIRHIAFSSAFFGFASFGLDFALTWQVVAYCALGLGLIGLMNLVVSFGLALYVAMKSRKLQFNQWRTFIFALLQRFNQYPIEFILPPKKIKEPQQDGECDENSEK